MTLWAHRDTALRYAKGLEAIGQLDTYTVKDFLRALFKLDEDEFNQLLSNYYRDHDPFQRELPLNATITPFADDRSSEDPILLGTPCDEPRVQVPEPPRS